ncbi:MAG: pseudouridine synthase [Chitinophagaceae bacterium]
MNTVNKYYLVYKPYNMVSQFVSNDNVPLLDGLAFPFPAGTHAIGRLDKFSEGLLLMTTNKKITRKLFDPVKSHERVYLLLVKGRVSDATIRSLKEGIEIVIENGQLYHARPKDVCISERPDFEFSVIEQAKIHGESTWLTMTLTEGKYHQVRKMAAAAGHKCLKLIRFSIVDLTIAGICPGEVREISETAFFAGLGFETDDISSTHL